MMPINLEMPVNLNRSVKDSLHVSETIVKKTSRKSNDEALCKYTGKPQLFQGPDLNVC